ncbi:MAG TPA: hypothetical protein VFF39_16085 [Verrucomicrobiae bacterium]|jgi:hypothetical protein|nr:hypothetical protein [Verrucomicrobiae bacterium]
MSAYAFLLVVLALVCTSALFFFFGRLSRFPCRTIRDVPAFLQPVDSANMMQLLNPETEEYLHSAMTGVALRLEQRRSLHFLREHLIRMSHNAHILLEWSNAELKREIVGQSEEYSECYRDCARQLHSAAIEFRLYAALSLFKIKLWLVFRTQPWIPLEPPILSDLGHVGSLRFFTLYSNLTRAVSNLGQHYGPEFCDEVLKAWAVAA